MRAGFLGIVGGLWLWMLGPSVAPSQEEFPAPPGTDVETVRVLLSQRQYAQAKSLATEMLAAETSRLGRAAPALATLIDLTVEATWRADLIADGALIDQAQRGLELHASTDSVAMLPSLRNLGACYEILGAWEPSIEYYDLALGVSERHLPPDDVRLADSLRNLANVLRIINVQEVSEAFFDRALAIFEDQLGSDHPEAVTTRTQRVRLYLNQGRFEAAEQEARAVLRACEAWTPADPKLVGMALESLGLVLDTAGQLDEALAVFERGLETMESAYGPDHVAVAILLNRFSNHLRDRGDIARSRAQLERTLSIVQPAFEDDHVYVVMTRNNLANIAGYEGDFATAIRVLENAREELEKSVGVDHPWVSSAWNDLAGNYLLANQPEAALRCFDQALEIDRKINGDDHPAVGIGSNNRAGALQALGRTEEAAAALKEGIAILEASAGPQDYYYLHGLASYGELLWTMGCLDEAETWLQDAVRVTREALGEHPLVAENQLNLARVSTARGDHAVAAERYAQALATFRSSLGDRHPDVARAAAGMAHSDLARGEFRAALRNALLAEELGREHLRLLARGSTERNALHYARHRVEGIDVAVRSALATGEVGDVRLAWDAVIRSRALVFDELAGRRWATASFEDPELVALFLQLRRSQERLANLVVRGPQNLQEGPYTELIANAAQQRDDAEEALALRSQRFRASRASEKAGLDAVREALMPGVALVSYLRFDHGESGRHYGAFVLVDGKVSLFDLGACEGIDAAVTQWRSAVNVGTAPSGPFGQNAMDQYREAGTLLRERIWDPFASELSGSSLVLMVPSGSLHHVSFGALPDDEDGFLVEGPPLQMLSSERDVLPVDTAPARGLLAMGGAAFDAGARADAPGLHRGADCAQFADLEFAPLPGTAQEVDAIAALWREAVDEPADVRLGLAATETALKTGAGGRRVVHLATHGFFLGDECGAEIRSRGAGVQGLFDTPYETDVVQPLLRSGLALTAANLRTTAPEGADDGILTSEEVAMLDLTGTEWVVLSACDTGRGDPVEGEGLLGLRRSFHLAGARTLITSLWPVDDQATRDWMRALYEARLRSGQGTADAVRTAALAVLADRRERGDSVHPFTWGGFVAAGDWR